MQHLRHRLRRWSWIAFLAVFGLALAPTISHALAAVKADGGWAEVCTPTGTRLVALDSGTAVFGASGAASAAADAAPDSGPAPSHLAHCPLCGLAGHAFAPPPASPAAMPPVGQPGVVPALFLQARRPLFAWASAQPRGPPAA